MGFDDLKYGKWQDGKKCGHNARFLMIEHIKHVEVPMTGEGVRFLVNQTRFSLPTLILPPPFGLGWSLLALSLAFTGPSTFEDLTHEAIECFYQCEVCRAKGYYTMDFSDSGKRLRFGVYQRQFKPISVLTMNTSDRLSVRSVQNTFDNTWPHDNERTYCMFWNNCKMFARKLWSNIGELAGIHRREFAKWQSEDSCGHDLGDLKIRRVEHVKVPLSTDTTHEEVDCIYCCDICGATGYYTMDFCEYGKRNVFGVYTKRFSAKAPMNTLHFDSFVSVQYVRTIFENTWRHDNEETYNALNRNDTMFCNELWTNIHWELRVQHFEKWEDEEICDHDLRDLKIDRIEHLEVPINDNATHEMIECFYQCNVCQATGSYTMEFSPFGKRQRFGNYQMRRHTPKDVMDIEGKFSIQMAKGVFENTWPQEDAHSYNVTKCNSKKFAGELYLDLELEQLKRKLEQKHEQLREMEQERERQWDSQFSGWQDGKCCGHHLRDLKVEHVQVKKIGKLWSNVSQSILGLIRGNLVFPSFQDLTHHVIECFYKCEECDDKGYYTMEFSPCGMRDRYGVYAKDFKSISAMKTSLSLEQVRNVYWDTWPHDDAETYGVNRNSKMFAGELFMNLKK